MSHQSRLLDFRANHDAGRIAEEEKRKQEWLAAEDGAEQPDKRVVQPPGQRKNLYGLDLDIFNNPGGEKPVDWSTAVKIAGWVAVDEMKTLLELHYATRGTVCS